MSDDGVVASDVPPRYLFFVERTDGLTYARSEGHEAVFYKAPNLAMRQL